MGLGSLFRSSYELLSLKYIIHNSFAGAVADEPILRILLHLLIVFKTFIVLFLNSALFCLVYCAHLNLAAARPNFFLSKKIAKKIL